MLECLLSPLIPATLMLKLWGIIERIIIMETLLQKPYKLGILDLVNYIVLFAYSFLFIIMQSVIYRNYMDEVITAEYLLGLALTGITVYRFFKLSKEGRLDWLKLRYATFLYFAVRIATLLLMGFEASTRKTGYFEGVYLLALSELTIDVKLLKKWILPTLLSVNLLLNIVNLGTQLFFGVGDEKQPLRHLQFFKAVKKSFYRYPNFWYHNINYIGIFTAFCLLVAICLVHERGKLNQKEKILFGAYVVFQGYHIYVSHSRAATLSFLICLIVLVVNDKLKIHPKKVLLGFLAIMVSCIIAMIGFIVAHDKTGLPYYEGDVQYNELTDLEKTINKASSSRYAIWKNSYYVMKDPKFLLFGSGNIEREHYNRDDYKKESYAEITGDTSGFVPNTYAHDHNGYFAMLTVTGLLGAIFFGITIKKRIDHSLILDKGLWYILFCYAATLNQFEVVTILHKRSITLILILILAVSTYGKETKANAE